MSNCDRLNRLQPAAQVPLTSSAVVMMVGPWPKGRWFDSEPKQYFPGFRGTVGESRRKILLMSSRLSAGLRRLLAKHTPALLGMQSTVWGDSHMLPSRGVRVWAVYLTPKIERVISLLSASPVGEARCRCCKVWLTRIDYYYYYPAQANHIMCLLSCCATALLCLSTADQLLSHPTAAVAADATACVGPLMLHLLRDCRQKL
jgi:hypothetical protein